MSSGSTHLEHIKNKKDEAKSAVASQEVRRHLAGFIMSKRSCSQLSSADSSSGGGSTCASSSKQKSLEQQVSIASLQSSSASNDVCLLAANAPLGHEQYAPGTTTSSSSIAAKLVDEHPLRKTASMPTMHIPRKSQSVSRRKQMERRTTLSPLMRRQQVPRVARRRTSQQQHELAGVLGTSRSGSSSPKQQQQQQQQRGKQKLSFQHHRNQFVTLDTFDEEMFRNDLQQAALSSRLSLSGFQNKSTVQHQQQQYKHQTLFKTSSNPQLPGDMDSNASNDIDMIDLSDKKTIDCSSDSVSLSRNLSNLANKLRNLDALGSDFTNSDAQQQQQQHFVDAHTLLRQQQHKKVNQAIRKTVLERSSQTNRSRALIGGSLDHPDSTCRPLGPGYSTFATINQRSLDAGSAFSKRSVVSPMLAHQNSAITTPRCSALRQQHSSSSSTTSTSSLLSSSQQDSFDELIAQAIDLSSSNCDSSSKRWPTTKQQQQQAQLSTSRLVSATSTANCPSQNPAAHAIINTSTTAPPLPPLQTASTTATLDPIYNQKMLQDSFNQLQLCQAQQQQQHHQVAAEQQTLASYRFAAETTNARQRLVAAHRDTYSLDRRLFGGNSRNPVAPSTQLGTSNATTTTTTLAADNNQANLIAEWHSQQQQQHQPTLCQVADYEKHQLLASQSSALLAQIFHHHQQVPSSVVVEQHNHLPQRRHESLAATGRALSSPLLPFAMSEKQQVLNEHLLMLHRLTSVNQPQTLPTQISETSAIELLKQSSLDASKQQLQQQAEAKLSFNFSELDSEQVSTRFILNPIFDDSSSTGLTYDLELCNHKCICNNELNHPENSKRVLAIWRRLHDSGLMAKCARIYTRPASLQDLQLCHSQAHCLYFATTPHERIKICEFDAQKLASLDGLLQLECGGIGVDIDTAWNEYLTPKAAILAAGGAIQATLAVASGKLQNAFAIIRPPGHHAEHQQVMGFCFFNNIAIAAKTLLQTMPGQFERILIVDLDIHHGNGTQKIFYDSNSVMYISLHRHDNGSFFPGTGYVQEIGIGAGRGYNWNIAWFDEMMADCEYITAFQTFVMPLASQFEPQIVLVACGFDAARGHPTNFGGYKVSAACFNLMISLLKRLANGRLVLCLEGGYQLDAIADCAEQCVRSLLGDTQNAEIEPSELSRAPVKSAIEVLEEISVLAGK